METKYISFEQDAVSDWMEKVNSHRQQGGRVEEETNEAYSVYKLYVGGTEVFDCLYIYHYGGGFYYPHHQELVHVKGEAGKHLMTFTFLVEKEVKDVAIFQAEPIEFSVDGVFVLHTSFENLPGPGYFLQEVTTEDMPEKEAIIARTLAQLGFTACLSYPGELFISGQEFEEVDFMVVRDYLLDHDINVDVALGSQGILITL